MTSNEKQLSLAATTSLSELASFQWYLDTAPNTVATYQSIPTLHAFDMVVYESRAVLVIAIRYLVAPLL